MVMWNARVSVTRKQRGTGKMIYSQEMEYNRKTYPELMSVIKTVMDCYENDLYATNVVIKKLVTL